MAPPDQWLSCRQPRVSLGTSMPRYSLSAVGVYIGHLFGAKFKSKAELAGGIVLILMGLRILLEHLGVLDWFFGLFT